MHPGFFCIRLFKLQVYKWLRIISYFKVIFQYSILRIVFLMFPILKITQSCSLGFASL